MPSNPASRMPFGPWTNPVQAHDSALLPGEAPVAEWQLLRQRRGGGPRVLVIDCAEGDAGRGMAPLARDLLRREGVQATVLRLGATPEAMAALVRSWIAAHGVLICTPLSGLAPDGALAQAIDRLDCSAGMARFPDYLADRVYGVAVCGNTLLAEEGRRELARKLDRMGLVNSSTFAQLDRHAGYYEPSCGDIMGGDSSDFAEQVENVALAVCRGVRDLCAGRVPRFARPQRIHHYSA